MKIVTSHDGTALACESIGAGPELVLIGTRGENAPLARSLADHFRVTTYDQRGYGESGDVQPYAVAREIEDLEAVLELAEGPVGVFGTSAAGALALEAAGAGLNIGGLAVFEVPYGIRTREEWRDYRASLARHFAAGRRGDAFALFMAVAGSTDAQIARARESAYWPQCEAIAHTRLYGAEVLGDGQVPTDRLSRVRCPLLVLTGRGGDENMSRLPDGAFDRAAASIARAVDDARVATIDSSGHEPDPAALATELVPFFRRVLATP